MLLVPRDELDCFLLAQLNCFGTARAGIPRHLEQCTIPETRSRALKALHHLVRVTNTLRAPYYFGGDPALRHRILQVALDNLEYGLFNTTMGEILSAPLEVGESVFQAVHEALAKNARFKFAEISERCVASGPA